MLLHRGCHGSCSWAAVWGASIVALAVGIDHPSTSGGAGGDDREVVRRLASLSQDAGSDQSENRRLREGSELIEQLGHFDMAKDRVVFVSERNGIRLVGLENLNLERISRTIAGSPNRLKWKVSGTVTEFRGANYLLIHRASVTTATH